MHVGAFTFVSRARDIDHRVYLSASDTCDFSTHLELGCPGIDARYWKRNCTVKVQVVREKRRLVQLPAQQSAWRRLDRMLGYFQAWLHVVTTD